jgi:hypothetical protein
MPQQSHDIIKGGFRKRKLPLSADYRPLYKIGIIVLILKMVSAGGKSSLNKLHFFIWALKSTRNMQFMRIILESNDSSSIVSWGVEPALNKALQFGIAEGLMSMHDDKYLLTEQGIAFAKKIEKDKDVLINEKEFLLFVGKRKVTEGFINDLTSKMSN